METSETCPTCGATMSEPLRDPRGVPTGGQYAPMPRSETPLTLVPKDGTWMFPPTLTTPEEIIEFWTNEPVPDESLARMDELYRRYWQVTIDQWPEMAWNYGPRGRWVETDPKPRNDGPEAIAAWEQRREAAAHAYKTALWHRLPQRPERLPRADLRSYARCAAIFSQAVELEPKEFLETGSHVLEFSDGPKTVQDAVVESGVFFFSQGFLDHDVMRADKEKEELARIRGALEEVVSGSDARIIDRIEEHREVTLETAHMLNNSIAGGR